MAHTEWALTIAAVKMGQEGCVPSKEGRFKLARELSESLGKFVISRPGVRLLHLAVYNGQAISETEREME